MTSRHDNKLTRRTRVVLLLALAVSVGCARQAIEPLNAAETTSTTLDKPPPSGSSPTTSTSSQPFPDEIPIPRELPGPARSVEWWDLERSVDLEAAAASLSFAGHELSVMVESLLLTMARGESTLPELRSRFSGAIDYAADLGSGVAFKPITIGATSEIDASALAEEFASLHHHFINTADALRYRLDTNELTQAVEGYRGMYPDLVADLIALTEMADITCSEPIGLLPTTLAIYLLHWLDHAPEAEIERAGSLESLALLGAELVELTSAMELSGSGDRVNEASRAWFEYTIRAGARAIDGYEHARRSFIEALDAEQWETSSPLSVCEEAPST